MTTALIDSPLARLTPIALDELTSRASLQTRVDRKYILPMPETRRLLAGMGVDARVLEIGPARSFAYQSVYYDTPELASYLLNAHRRRHRFKVRTRTYLDSDLCWLEVKTPGIHGTTVKERVSYDKPTEPTLGAGRRFVESILTGRSGAVVRDHDLTPVLTTWYRRSTLYLPTTNSRVTIDTDLRWEDNHRHGRSLPDMAIVETKTGSAPSAVDRLLWAGGRRPVRMSKYTTCLAALRPHLPATRWRLTLRRYFPVENLAPPTCPHPTATSPLSRHPWR